jgi:hypothetical protein
LINDSQPDVLDVTFCGPAVKLLVIRKPRPHPWPVGTSFHQSGGLELSEVRWDASKRELSGRLNRPPGQSGSIHIAGVLSGQQVTATVDGKMTPHTLMGDDAMSIPLTTRQDSTQWSVQL